jgi:hypothetical protein
MTNKFFNLNPTSEPEMQSLFIKYFPLEPLPADFAIRLKERVLTEVTLVIKPVITKPGGGEMQFLPLGLKPLRRKLSRWFARRFFLFMLMNMIMLWLAIFLFATI